MSGKVYELVDEQRRAVAPDESVWLSASAGTGKTQVLSARVLRLLLQEDVDPSQILCLTFTKAGAAEMALRINAVLARWVRIKDEVLSKELGYLGADGKPATLARARTLFASVLDCPGGGLRIDTIHAFSQWLLANFPVEAGLAAGTRPIEDRERELLAREVLADLLEEAQAKGDGALLDAVSKFVKRKGSDGLQKWLLRCAKAHDLWFGPGAWQAPMRAQVLQALGLPSDAGEDMLAALCSDEAFDIASLQQCAEHYRGWKTKTADKALAAIGDWLAADAKQRIGKFDALAGALFFKNGNPRLPKSADAAFAEASARVGNCLAALSEKRDLLAYADFLVPALELGCKFAHAWDAAKRQAGLIDFDDLIRMAADLLSNREAADWIRYKLDRRFDHILIDEAQDTNKPQWDIIFALIDDFFAGEGAAGDKLRTIFAVGDYKQAIFGFQGTSPDNFTKAKARVKQAMHDMAENAVLARRNLPARELREFDLSESFRTSAPVLDFVDQAIEEIGYQSFGLDTKVKRHQGEEGPGLVTLWNPVRDQSDSGEHREDDSEDDGKEGWIAPHDRLLAEKIASQLSRWLTDEPVALAKDGHRNARAGDIMVLVRSRKQLASLIVARLHAHGVPVAGVDRLRLGAPLAVKDLMAAVRFAAQPLDDLALANLLSSPLLGWSQDDLCEHLPRPEKKPLWHHLRGLDNAFVSQSVAQLGELLARADFETPQSLLQWMLIDGWNGRAKLVARLGHEANDPIDELVNAAYGYEAAHTPSLAGFIQWFDAGESELKRDPDDAPDLVRVMTVHGAKGLESPIVILADAASKPGDKHDLELEEANLGSGDLRKMPLPPTNKEERAGLLARIHADQKADDLKEHWRLLYVALTRAKEALFVTGSLGKKASALPEDSWFARLETLFEGEPIADDLWGARREWGTRANPVKPGKEHNAPPPARLPDWALTPVGPEPHPPRPLAPSSAGEEAGSEPPLAPDALRFAARRGVLIHRLLERLPDIAPEKRADGAKKWLAAQADDLDESAREEIAASALSVLENAEFAPVFGPGSLAEVPLAASVGGRVIAGTADRLLVREGEVMVVDYKTARRPPRRLAEINPAILKQMAAYVCALEVIYPGRKVSAALLYTQTPQLFALPEALLAPHKRALSGAREGAGEGAD